MPISLVSKKDNTSIGTRALCSLVPVPFSSFSLSNFSHAFALLDFLSLSLSHFWSLHPFSLLFVHPSPRCLAAATALSACFLSPFFLSRCPLGFLYLSPSAPSFFFFFFFVLSPCYIYSLFCVASLMFSCFARSEVSFGIYLLILSSFSRVYMRLLQPAHTHTHTHTFSLSWPCRLFHQLLMLSS